MDKKHSNGRLDVKKERHENGEPDQQEMPVPTEWPDYIQERMNQAYAASFEAMGIKRDDQEARKANWKNNFVFFNAPVAVILCLDSSLTDWSILDLGHFGQS